MKFNCEYCLERGPGQAETGPAAADLLEESLTLSPKKRQALVIPWEEIFSFSLADYKAVLALRQAALAISSLGYKFEDFARLAAKFRNERLLKLSLAEEPLKKSMIEADLAYKGPAGEFFCRCELRIYETSLVALPETADFVRLPFRFITDIKEGDYTVEVSGETGEVWRLTGLGKNYDYFCESLRAEMGELDLFVQNALCAALPGVPPLDIRKLAALSREGRLIPLSELEKAVPGTAAGLEKRIYSDKTDAGEYSFLKKISVPGKTAFAIKKGLMGALSGDHYMFVFCVDKPAPAVVVESFLLGTKDEGTSTDKTATYLYRLPPGDARSETFLSFFNRAMTAVNFRRMPILLSDESLANPKYALYAGALARVPELKELRGLYIGRAIHGTPEQWSADITAAAEFAARNPSPGCRWKKAGDPEEGGEVPVEAAGKEAE